MDFKNIFILNTEQLTRNNINDEFKYYSDNFKIINYSLENNKIIKGYYLPYQVNYNELLNLKKDKDICFIGYLSRYRKNILDKLKNKINYIDNLWGY